MEPGIRVGAILDADNEKVRLFGYGVYQGDYIPEDNSIVHPLFGVAIKRLQVKNPKILLDSGEEVWGCECWWGPEDKVREEISGRIVEMVSVRDYRIPEDPEMVSTIEEMFSDS